MIQWWWCRSGDAMLLLFSLSNFQVLVDDWLGCWFSLGQSLHCFLLIWPFALRVKKWVVRDCSHQTIAMAIASYFAVCTCIVFAVHSDTVQNSCVACTTCKLLFSLFMVAIGSMFPPGAHMQVRWKHPEIVDMHVMNRFRLRFDIFLCCHVCHVSICITWLDSIRLIW